MEEIKIGMSQMVSKVVSKEMTALEMGSGDMEVFATPSMIALMENAAMLLVAPLLTEGDSTVGIHIEADHTRATSVGATVECIAKVVGVDGRKISFEIEAKDNKGVIGTAKHDRFVVNREKFLSRL